MAGKKVVIVGATGAVGVEMLKVLEESRFPVRELVLLASEKSAGKIMEFGGEPITVQALRQHSFAGADIALFSAGGDISRKYVPYALHNSSCVVIDNSSAFRMHRTVPLVIPEINAADVAKHQGLIANPNCTTAITLMALYPLHQAFGCKRAIAASYQAVSGTGAKAVDELVRQVGQYVRGEAPTHEVYPHPIAFNVLPHIGHMLPSGYTDEEEKLMHEGRKIMRHPNFRASTTCVRVPVFRAHAVAVSAEFEQKVSVEEARIVLQGAPGLDVVDDPAASIYPQPLVQAGKYNCAVGRLRKDSAFYNGLSLWVCGDQLLKGAALNAVQIAELLL